MAPTGTRSVMVSEEHRASLGVGAILRHGEDHVLMQLRDTDKPIWFPGHWGLFGGALEGTESEEQAIAREVEEEIGLSGLEYQFFTQVAFDARTFNGGIRGRSIFIAEIDSDQVRHARNNLAEGMECRALPLSQLIDGPYHVTPYDKFALHLFSERDHLAQAARWP